MNDTLWCSSPLTSVERQLFLPKSIGTAAIVRTETGTTRSRKKEKPVDLYSNSKQQKNNSNAAIARYCSINHNDEQQQQSKNRCNSEDAIQLFETPKRHLNHGCSEGKTVY